MPRALFVVRFALALPFLLVCLAPAAAQAPVFPPASRIGMVPPPGFVLSTTFSGFQHNDKQANIVFNELPARAYEAIEREMRVQAERNPALRLEAVALAPPLEGLAVAGTQNGPQGPIRTWTLLARAHALTAVVSVAIPEAVQDVASDAALRAALASVTIRPSVPTEELLSVLPFSLMELAGFRIARVHPGAAILLTEGARDDAPPAEQPLLLVTIVAAPNRPQPEERDRLARRFLAETPGLKDMRVVHADAVRIANQPGYEMVVEAKAIDGDADLKAVQWLRFGSGTLLRVLGIGRKDDWPALYRRFSQVREGIGSK